MILIVEGDNMNKEDNNEMIFQLRRCLNLRCENLIQMGYKLYNTSMLKLDTAGLLDGTIADLSITDGYFTFKFEIATYATGKNYKDIKERFDMLDIEIDRLIELKSKNLLS